MSVGISKANILPLPLSPSPQAHRRGATLFPQYANASKPPSQPKQSALFGRGLTPPPSATMSTTYHQSLAAYDNYAPPSHAVNFGPASIGKPTNDPAAFCARQRQGPVATQPTYPQSNTMSQTTTLTYSSTSQSTSRPTTPPSISTAKTSNEKKPADGLIYHSLSIPKCISPNGGNLADFAAQMTCLFWFQPMEDLKMAETIQSRPHDAPVSRLQPLAKPHEQFRKWVYSVLSTTQVTQNVILLALLFIYRLKKSTPQIKGRAGSEYRLLTVALMLGNKFLDDNTYTNKTWAEVSCFAVQEIHVMEVEFLSNMRYNLLASHSEWDDWLGKLACFFDYYERASRPPTSPLHIASPHHQSFVSPISSPLAAAYYDMPPVTPSGKKHTSPSTSHSQSWNPYQANTTSPLAAKPVMQPTQSRKRSYDDSADEHPAKRHMPPSMVYNAQHADDLSARLHSATQASRLPVPQLSVVTNAAPIAPGYPVQAAAYVPSQAPVALPPLVPGTRSMATVYPQATGIQYPLAAASAPAPAPAQYTTQVPVPVAHPVALHTGTPSKRRSPGSLAPFASSPMAEAYAANSAMHTPLALTPIANSPSVYLQHRNSPYKPIRHVNTLLHPPPSASLEQYQLSLPVPPSQMHYQPLGRRYDLRTGIVPEFVRYHRAQQQQYQVQPPVVPPNNAVQQTGYMGQYAP